MARNLGGSKLCLSLKLVFLCHRMSHHCEDLLCAGQCWSHFFVLGLGTVAAAVLCPMACRTSWHACFVLCMDSPAVCTCDVYIIIMIWLQPSAVSTAHTVCEGTAHWCPHLRSRKQQPADCSHQGHPLAVSNAVLLLHHCPRHFLFSQTSAGVRC